MNLTRILSPFVVDGQTRNRKFSNTNRLARVWYLRRLYTNLVWRTLRRTSFRDTVRTQFPFVLKDAAVPPALSVELTNLCNVRCTYCTSPLKERPQGLMSPETFGNLIRQIEESGIRKVKLVGNGEPTIHPKFSEMIPQLVKAARFVTLTTNALALNETIIESILAAPVDVLHISVDGGTREEYERSRVGGKFDKLLQNLGLLRQMKRDRRAKTLVNVRVMLRPSQRSQEGALRQFWSLLSDVVSQQYVMDFTGSDTDVYPSADDHDACPRCTLPFKILDVRWNGDVPLCSYSQFQTGDKIGLLLGNLNQVSLAEMWNGERIKAYRAAQRQRNAAQMPVCKGCKHAS
jgi:MoaA/NifB/PqqE/SkfB family radical SAM enzyme